MASCSSDMKPVEIDSELYFWFGQLPSEVVLLIFRMLDTSSLLCIQETKDARLKHLSYAISKADFSDHQTVSPQDFKAYLSPRLLHVTDLNINHLKFVKPSFLQNLVLGCKLLKILSAKQCGFTFDNILSIFVKLDKIVDFTWDVNNVTKNIVPAAITAINNIEKLSIQIEDSKSFFFFIKFFFSYCNKLQDLRIDFSEIPCDFYRDRLINFVEDVEKCKFIDLNNLIIEDHSNVGIHRLRLYSGAYPLNGFINWMCSARNLKNRWKKLWIYPDLFENTEYLFECIGDTTKNLTAASCLYLRDKENYDNKHALSVLEVSSPLSVETLGISPFQLDSELIDNICRVGGNRLKHFSAGNYAESGCLKVGAHLESLLKCCNNITELNLKGVHFDEGVSCSAISHLKKLRRLSLSSCAVKDSNPTTINTSSKLSESFVKKKTWISRLPSRNANLTSPFGDMVRSCNMVEEFHLTGCSRCSLPSQPTSNGNCKDEDLADLYLWTNLKHLRLEELHHLQFCRFLESITQHCKRFRSLHLCKIGHPKVCLFLPNVLYLLKNSRFLIFLSITQPMFNCQNEDFWNAISKASNLQGLCISTTFRCNINTKIILRSIAELKNFSVFHFRYPHGIMNETLHHKTRILLSKKTGRMNVDVFVGSIHLSEPVINPMCYFRHCGVCDTTIASP